MIVENGIEIVTAHDDEDEEEDEEQEQKTKAEGGMPTIKEETQIQNEPT